jgi:hypothetical protein
MEIEQKRKNDIYDNPFISNHNSLDDLYNDINDSDENVKFVKDKKNNPKKNEIIDLNDNIDENKNFIGKKRQ